MNDKVFPEEIVRISMSRKVCQGGCTVDWVEFNADGQARCKGHNYVQHEESLRATISKRRWHLLVKKILENRYFDLKSNYPGAVTDQPSEYMRVDTLGFYKEVNCDATEKPAELARIHNYIEELLNRIDWQPVSEE